ncbi:MAG: hypothetical protein JWM32_393 [Verrucomicrobia bacterium]|nr:hypothetical protein [Verrucomicrobiota bacterium]
MKSLPDPEGFAAPFTGVAGGALLVAGGANFPGKRPWEGGTKIWSDEVYLLAARDADWIKVGKLPRANAYGVSVTIPEGVICAGGGDARENFADVFLLKWDGRMLSRDQWPALPRPCAFMSGAKVGKTFYLAGGTATPTDTAALSTFWALDLNAPECGWRELPPCPGAPRMLAVAGSIDETFYLMSGVSLKSDAAGKPVRTYLNDAYAYRAGKGWTRLADLPRPAVAAPSPAPLARDGQLLVIGGDDGGRRHLDGPGHPGFPRDILAYDPSRDRWSVRGQAPFSRATVPATEWDRQWIVPNGERIPGYRSPEVWALERERRKVFA